MSELTDDIGTVLRASGISLPPLSNRTSTPLGHDSATWSEPGENLLNGRWCETARSSGRRRDPDVELSFAIVHDRDAEVIGAMAQARDITERFERDRTMRRRLRDLEKAPDMAGSVDSKRAEFMTP